MQRSPLQGPAQFPTSQVSRLSLDHRTVMSTVSKVSLGGGHGHLIAMRDSLIPSCKAVVNIDDAYMSFDLILFYNLS